MALPPSPTGLTLAGNLWNEAFSRLDESLKSSLAHAKTNKRDVLATVLKAVQDKRNTSLQKRWKVRLPNNKVVIVRDVLEKITRWVVRFREIGDVAVQFDPAHASLPWAAVRFLLQTTVNDVEQYGAMIMDIEVIARLITRYKEFELLYRPGNSSALSTLDDALTSLYAEVLTYLARTIDIFSEKTMVRLAKAPFRLGDEAQMQRILKREDEVAKLAKLNDTERLHSLETSLVRLLDQASISNQILDDERHVQMIRWLSTSPYSAHHESITETRVPKFGQWLLQHEEFKDWCQSSSPSMLLVVGIPGSGKTHLCSAVVDELLKTASSQASSAPFSYFYCSTTDSEPERSSVDEILRSILRQLTITDASTQPRVRCLLDNEFERRSKSARLSGLDLPKLKTKDCVDLIIELVNDDPVTIVLDAIDEVQDAQRLHLFDELHRILNQAANIVKIFLTSRNDGEVLSSFPSATILSINSANVRGDMQDYIHRELDSARLLNGCISPQVRTELADALLSGAGEMFLWARLQIQQLRMRKILHEEDLLPALRTNILSDLDHLYGETLQQVLNRGDKSRSFVIHVFAWLLYMKSPLAMSTLLEAMALTSAGAATLQPAQVCEMCAHLIVADSRRDNIEFAHHSIKEYLLRTKQETFSPSLSHSLLASNCIDVCSRGPPGGQPLEMQTTSMYVYSTIYWAMHFKDSEVTRRESELFLHMLSFVVDEDDTAASLAFETWMDTAAELVTLLPNHHPMKATLDAISNDQSSPIFLAAVFGLDGLLEYLAESDPKTDWNQRNRLGHTAVYLAAARGHAPTLSILIDQGADVNIECGKYGSPLHAACYRGHEKVVTQLLSHNVSDTCGTKFKNALDACARGDNEKIAVTLVQSGVIKTPADYEHALQAAAEFGFTSLLTELQLARYNQFSKGDMSDKQKKRSTKAIKGGQLGVLQRFLSRAVEPSTMLAPSAVATAATYGHNDIIRFLLGIGMDIEAEGEFGTPLRSACLMGRTSTVQLLLEHGAGAKPGSLDVDALHAAAAKGHSGIVRLLVEEGADVNKSVKGSTFGTALEAAAYNGHKGVVGILVDAGANVHKEGTFRDAFHAAAEGGQHEIVLWFLKRGYTFKLEVELHSLAPASPPRSKNSRFAKGKDFPLEASAAAGRLSVVRLLLDQRRYLGITGRAVVGAIEAAAAHGHVEVLELLLRSHAMDQRGVIKEVLPLLVKSAGESRSPSVIKLALNFASQHGIAADQINRLQSQWPPTAEKYEFAFVDKQQLQHDFMGACQSGDEDGVCSIIDCKYGPLLDHGDFRQASMILAGAGNEALLKIILGQVRRLFPLQPLVSDDACIEAANNNHVNVLRLLLSQKGHSEETTTLLGRLACIACGNAHVDIIRFLVEELKLDVNTEVIEDTNGIGPSIDASADKQRSKGSCRTSLLQATLRAFKKPDSSCPRCIHRAFMNMDEDNVLRTDVVTYLLANGADPSRLGGQDAFPLSVAVKICPEIVVRKLIDAGADVTCEQDGSSAMDAAMTRDWASGRIIRMILEAGGTLPAASWKAQLLIGRVSKSMTVDYLRGAKENVFFPPCQIDALAEPPGIKICAQKMPTVSERVFKDEMGAMLNLLELFLRHYAGLQTAALHYAVFLEAACRLGRQELVEVLLSRGTDPNGSEDFHCTPIEVAAGHGHLGIVELLLEHGVSVHEVQGRRNRALESAIGAGHINIVQLLLSLGADPNSKARIPNLDGTKGGSRHSASPLAIKNGGAGVVNALLEADGVVDEDEESLGHRLILACEKGCIDTVTALIQAGAPVNIVGELHHEDASPLRAAIDGGHVQVVELLLKNGADVNMDVTTPALVAAVKKRDLHIVRKLLVAGADINHVRSFLLPKGGTALFDAVWNGDLPIVRELLAKEAAAVGPEFPNCLVKACRVASVDIIELLLENIFDNHDHPEPFVDEALGDDELQVYRPEDWDIVLRLLLDYLPPTQQRFAHVCSFGSVSMAASMLDAGIGVDGQDAEQRPIHIAARNLRAGVTRILVQRGADISSKNPEGETPLSCALLSCAEHLVWGLKHKQANGFLTKLHEDDHRPDIYGPIMIFECETIVRLLIDNGADLDDDCGGFGKPLHIACLVGSTAIVTALIDSGVNVNAVDGYFGTCLFAAIYGRHFDVVCLLLDQGANVDYMHQVHGTPLHFACAVNDGDITCKLLQHGASIAVPDLAGDTALTIALRACKSTVNDPKAYARSSDLDRLYEESSLFSIMLQMPQSVCVTEQDILRAAQMKQGADILASLLEINKQMLISEDTIVHLLELKKSPDVGGLKPLFKRSGGLGITERMLMTAPCASTLEGLAESLPVCKVTPAIMESQTDPRSLAILLDICDIVDITEGVVLKALGHADWHDRPESNVLILDTIWRRKPTMPITRSMLIAAKSPEILEFLLKRLAPANGILRDVALSLIEEKYGCPAELFCLLVSYDKDKEINLDEGMISKVRKPSNWKSLDVFLTHAPNLVITEELFLRMFNAWAVETDNPRIKLLEILLKHDKKFIFTQNIRDAIDSAFCRPEDMKNKQLFYSLRERDETVAEAEARCPRVIRRTVKAKRI